MAIWFIHIPMITHWNCRSKARLYTVQFQVSIDKIYLSLLFHIFRVPVFIYGNKNKTTLHLLHWIYLLSLCN